MKQRVEAAVPALETYPVRLKIEGLRADYQEEGVFTLDLPRPMDVEWPRVAEVLRDAGLDAEDTDMAVEHFARWLEIRTLATVLAKRTRRIG